MTRSSSPIRSSTLLGHIQPHSGWFPSQDLTRVLQGSEFVQSMNGWDSHLFESNIQLENSPSAGIPENVTIVCVSLRCVAEHHPTRNPVRSQGNFYQRFVLTFRGFNRSLFSQSCSRFLISSMDPFILFFYFIFFAKRNEKQKRTLNFVQYT